MSLRLAVGWLEARIWARVTDPDDLADWLAGNDDELRARTQTRRRSMIIEAGGEVH